MLFNIIWIKITTSTLNYYYDYYILLLLLIGFVKQNMSTKPSHSTSFNHKHNTTETKLVWWCVVVVFVVGRNE